MSRANALNDEMSANKSLNDVVRALFYWALGVGVIFTILYAALGRINFEIMTNDETVIEAAMAYIGWLIAMPIISTLAFMWDGVYVGATAGVPIRNSMIWAAVAFVGGYLLTYRWLGPQALYIGYFAHLIARAVYLTLKWKETYTY